MKNENEKASNFQKFHLNKVLPVKGSRNSNKSLTPERVRSEKANNNSSLYDVSIKGGSIHEKFQGSKNYG